MNSLRFLLILWALFATSTTAFEFNNSSANYDFTQTVEILIVDQKNSKFFAMRDPFEMLVTTTPSRFYVAVMGVLQRGHTQVDGVAQLQGAVADYEYVLIFRSLNSSHVMYIGQNWVVDGNKKIRLTAEEIPAIYDLLTTISGNGQKMDLNILENLFKEIDTQQDASINPKLTPEEELKSIIDSQKSIQERLPQNHDDMKTLPAYNKAEENRRFLEEYDTSKKLEPENAAATANPENPAKITFDQTYEKTESRTAEGVITPAARPATIEQNNLANVRGDAGKNNSLLLITLIALAMVLGSYGLHKRRTRKS